VLGISVIQHVQDSEIVFARLHEGGPLFDRQLHQTDSQFLEKHFFKCSRTQSVLQESSSNRDNLVDWIEFKQRKSANQIRTALTSRYGFKATELQ